MARFVMGMEGVIESFCQISLVLKFLNGRNKNEKELKKIAKDSSGHFVWWANYLTPI